MEIMTAEQKKLMWQTAIMDFVPAFLMAFTGIYVRLYVCRHVNADDLAISLIVESALCTLTYQILSSEVVIRFTTKYCLLLSALASLLLVVQASVLKEHPAIAIIVGSINLAVFIKLCNNGFVDIVNQIFIRTARTIQKNRANQMFSLGLLLSGSLAYMINELDIDIVVKLLYLSATCVLVTDTITYTLLKRYMKNHPIDTSDTND